MKKILILIAAVLLTTTAHAEFPAVRNDNASTTIVPANGGFGQLSVTSKGRLFTPIDPLTEVGESPIPLSNSVGVVGPPVGNVGWTLVAADAVEAASTTTVLNLTAHVARIGDAVFSQTGTAANQRAWSTVEAVTANTVTLSQPLPATPAAADQVLIIRPVPIFASGAPSGQSGAALMVNIDSGYQNATGNGILKTEDAAAGSGDAGVASLYKAQSALSSDQTANDYGVPRIDMLGRTMVGFAPSGEYWSACSASNTGTSDTAIKAAVASNRIYVTSMSCFNTAAVASSFEIKDGATAIYAGGISNSTLAGVAYWEHSFPVPLRLTSNTALNFDMATTATATTCCAAGFISVD